MSPKNAFYAQSGGVTAVINATACGLIETARRFPEQIGKVLVGQDGIIGALTETLLDTSLESVEDIAALRYLPGGAWGSSRYRLGSLDTHRSAYERLVEVFAAHRIAYFFFNGGDGSMAAVQQYAAAFRALGYPIACIGIPKTVDNDLTHTDTCPGFGSVAKYVATSMREAGIDLASMARTSTKVFILEAMGRDAGWIAAASGLAAARSGDPPHLLLFPERRFDPEGFLARVQSCVDAFGYCAITVAEGLCAQDGCPIGPLLQREEIVMARQAGVGQFVAELIRVHLGYRCHLARADYLQRAARHLASATDVAQAWAVGEAAVLTALAGRQEVMVTLERLSDLPYRWKTGEVPLSEVASRVRVVPDDFISEDGYHITEACRRYLSPLIEGEDPPRFVRGLPDYVRLRQVICPRQLPPFVLE